jgi:hypothetical protein
MEKPKLYVGCGLTLASEGFKNNVELLKDGLRSDWEVMEFLGLTDGTEVDVYQKDIIENVGGCDAFLGVCDEPSIGLGWELREATVLQKPTIAVAHVDSRITRLLLGAPAFNETMRFRSYENMVEDVPAILGEEFTVVQDGIVLARAVGAQR